MALAEIEQSALQLPLEERLRLARRLVESIEAPGDENSAIYEGIRRIESVASGKIPATSEAQFRGEWEELGAASLARAYGDAEPDYSLADLKRPL